MAILSKIDNKDPKFKIGDIDRISKYKNIFAKGYTPNWSEEAFVIKLKILCCGHMLLMILMEKLLEHFTKTNCKKTNQKEFRIGKVIKRKGGKLYVKWEGYNNSFNSWIDKRHSMTSEYFPKPNSLEANVKVE